MSYRTIKRLLGETSLERKCRFLLGGALLLLIACSFYFYYWLNRNLIYDQNRVTAHHLADYVLTIEHWKSDEAKNYQPVIDEFAADLRPTEFADYNYSLYKVGSNVDASHRPTDPMGYAALDEITRGAPEYIRILEKEEKYQYYEAVTAKESCISRCHKLLTPEIKAGDLMGMVHISMPFKQTKQVLAFNNAILITTAIVTASLAMLASVMIVRYVIVKPVLHLKDVSDEIARGNLDLRADIRTGDEFEELSHAFNRMLRHLVTVQDELRVVNTDLDGKVDELAQVNLRLYELNKLKDEFLANMSHELRTPLNSILGFSEVLGSADNLTDKQRRFLQNIQNSGRDLTALINDLLDLAKIESGKMELQTVEFSVGDLIEQQVASLTPLATKKNIDLTSDVDPNLPPLFQDPGKLQQILNNLLSNAIKFTPEGGRVQVRAASYDSRHLELVVEDTGIGIPLEDQEAIFEKFRQGRHVPGLRDSMTREYGGTGLGLSIVRELSKLLGGEVRLDSEFGKGSTFTVRLPIRLDELPETLDHDLSQEVAPVRTAVLTPAGATTNGNGDPSAIGAAGETTARR